MGKNPGSGMNIPDPYHWFFLLYLLDPDPKTVPCNESRSGRPKTYESGSATLPICIRKGYASNGKISYESASR
jgi:hypothetical protein